jgi:hypothetical protein
MDGDRMEVCSLPLVIHPRVRTALGRVLVVSCGVFFAGAGAAFASCPPQALSTPFSQWGDTNSYFLIPGGSFEGTADQVGWTLNDATLTPGNEPFQVDGASDDQSLTINAGGNATSPYFCVDNTMTDLRLFAQEVSPGGDLHVKALVQTPDGVARVPLADLADGSMPNWAPTDPITGDTSSIPDGDSVMVALRFSVPGSAGAWQLDDIYVDPWRSG